MRRKKRTQFINLAEQLALQNQIVDQTMDSLLDHVTQSPDAEQRSDWDEICKTAEQSDPSTRHATDTPNPVPRPRSLNRSTQRTPETA